MNNKKEPYIVQTYLWDNPARRLLQLMERAVQIPQNYNGIAACKSLLQTEDTNLLYKRLSIASRLPAQALEVLRSTNPTLNERSWKHWYHATTTLLTRPEIIVSTWSQSIVYADEHTLVGLENASALIDHRKPPGAIDTPEFRSIIEQITEVIAEVEKDTQLSQRTKKYILDTLREFIIRIVEVDFAGYQPVEELIEIAIGHNRDDGYQEFFRSTASSKYRTVLQDLAAYASIVGGAAAVAALDFTNIHIPFIK